RRASSSRIAAWKHRAGYRCVEVANARPDAGSADAHIPDRAKRWPCSGRDRGAQHFAARSDGDYSADFAPKARHSPRLLCGEETVNFRGHSRRGSPRELTTRVREQRLHCVLPVRLADSVLTGDLSPTAMPRLSLIERPG